MEMEEEEGDEEEEVLRRRGRRRRRGCGGARGAKVGLTGTSVRTKASPPRRVESYHRRLIGLLVDVSIADWQMSEFKSYDWLDRE